MQSTFVRSLVFPLLLALLLISLGPAPITQAATVYLNVDRFDDPAVTTAGTGAAACSLTTTNDCSLRGAILKANAPSSDVNIINLPAGTYTLALTGASEDLNQTGDLDITRDVTIAGAGASATVINANNLDRVLDIRSGNVTITGVTIRGGKAPDGPQGYEMPGLPITFPGGPGQSGGGLQIGGGIMTTATLTLTNSIVTANQSGAGGAGAVSSMGGTPSSGGPGGMGGGIYNNGTLLVISTTISSNSTGNGGIGASGTGGFMAIAGASGGNGGDGGGIYNSGTLTVTRSILQSNTAGNGGNGGVGAAGSSTSTTGGMGGPGGNGGNGGGIYNFSFMTGGILSLAGTTVAGNMTGDGGLGGTGGAGSGTSMPGLPAGLGGVGGTGGKGGSGSAIYNSGLATATNSTLSGNTAGNGGAGANGGMGGTPIGGAGGTGGTGGNAGNGGNGGIYNYNSLFTTATITITSATITANSTGIGGSPGSGGPGGIGTPNGNNGSPGANGGVGTGGGIALYGGALALKNTILADNTTPAGGQGPDCYGAITSQGYNFIRLLTDCTVGGTTIGNITDQDPKLSPLADNGGGTLTHALQPTSPARDAADPGGCHDPAGNLLLVDQRGLPRSYGGRCDIGAFELQGLFLPLLRR